MSDRLTIHCGDALETLRAMASGAVDCIVTSPPYFGLRDYGTATWEGGDDPTCDHLGKPFRTKASINANCGTGTDRKNADAREPFGALCGKCGAKRIDQQIGLEPTPDEYVVRLVEVFREARRVLADTGVMFCNIGDSYAANRTYQVTPTKWPGLVQGQPSKVPVGLKSKDLIGIPWLLVFALRADGWYLRQDIIWAKPNPMPESVRDRCTKAHEYVFLLSKRARYFYDAKAVSEPFAGKPYLGRQNGAIVNGDHADSGRTIGMTTDSRNKRSVWNITPKPFPGAHYAVMPVELAEICIKAGCPKGGTVLDPFGGAGTTAVAALRHGRKAVLIDLHPDNCTMARNRIDKEWFGDYMNGDLIGDTRVGDLL